MLLDSKTISMVLSQLPALTYVQYEGNTLKMHYYMFMRVHICAKLINSIQFERERERKKKSITK